MEEFCRDLSPAVGRNRNAFETEARQGTDMVLSPFVRQLMVAGAPQLAAFAVGGAVTYPSVLLQQFKSNDSTIHLDIHTASWLGSIHGVAGIPSILMPTIMQWQGRKFAFIASCLISIVGWLVAYSATTAGGILISESFHGLGTHCLLAVSMLSMSEMINPKFRNIAMVSFYTIQTFGMALVGVIARYIHWKTLSLIMCSSMLLAFFLACNWPESPSWLAYKGKFDECEKAFIWLRGADKNSMKELRQIISANKQQISSTKNERKTQRIMRYLTIIKRRDFFLPCLFTFLLLNVMYWSGILVVLIYSSDLIEQATGNDEIAALSGALVNALLFLGIALSSILLRYFSNKTILLCSINATSLSLVCSCLVTFLQHTGTLPKDSLLCFYCVIVFVFVNSLGISSLVFPMAAELMPVKHRGLGGAMYVIITCLLHGSSLKLAPFMFIYLNLWGTFLIYATNTIICGLLIWRYVPDANGKTLQEIEDYYNRTCPVRNQTSDVEGVALNDILEQ